MNQRQIVKALKKFNSFLVTAHINPEGDSIGSQIAISSLLRRMKKKVIILNESPVPHILRFMKGSENIRREKPDDFDFEAVVILDCPDMARVGDVSKYITEDKVVINIDHHVSNVNFGDHNWVDSCASSAGEMVYELFKKSRLSVQKDEAVAMYVAIMTDSGSFKYTNTSSLTHRVAAELIEKGVEPYDIYTRIYETSTVQDVSLLSESLSTLKVTADGKIAWLWVTKEMLKKTKASLEGTEGIINFARSIGGADIAVLFRETGTENKIKVSFRSKGRVDVNKLAGLFGGGGHVTASGCSVSGTIEEAEKKILEKAQEAVLATA